MLSSEPGIFRVKSAVYKEIRDSINESRKIQAIKTLRSAVGCGLKEAKFAIDRMCDEINHVSPGRAHPEARKVISGPSILKVTLDYGDGPVELNIEGMQLRALTELQDIGLESCNHMLHLVDVFNAISEGHDVHIRRVY